MSNNNHDSRSPEQLKALFSDQQWLITGRSQGDESYQTYLTDLVKAWKAADAQARQQVAAKQPPTALADCIRYALIHSTIVGNLGHPPPLPSVYGKDDDLTVSIDTLKNILPEPVVVKPAAPTIETALAIKDPVKRASSLIDLMESNTGEARVSLLHLAIDTILSIQINDYWRFPDHLWERLEPHLVGDHLHEYAQRIFTSSNEVARASYIRLVTKRGKDRSLWPAAIHSAISLRAPYQRTFTLWWLIRLVGGRYKARLLQLLYLAVPHFEDLRWKGLILNTLVQELKGKQRAKIIPQAMRVIAQTPGYHRGEEARGLLRYLSRAQGTRFLRMVLSGAGLISQVEACIMLWHYLPKRAHEQAISMALQVRDRPARAKYLAQIAAKLRGKALYQEAIGHMVSAIADIRNEDHRRKTIIDGLNQKNHDGLRRTHQSHLARTHSGLVASYLVAGPKHAEP